MQVRSAFARGGIAVLTAAAAVMVSAPSALADDGAARGRVDDAKSTQAYQVNTDKGTPYAKLFDFKLSDGKSLKLYCVEFDTHVRSDVDMLETPWNKYPNAGSPFNKNSAKINWVLHHGYPALGLDAVEAELAKQGVKVHDGLTEFEAITGTQAAAWHFSDGVNLNLKQPLLQDNPAEANADVAALYSYLIGDQNTGISAQPKPALDIAGPKTEGKAGTRIGPFQVATNGVITSLTTELPDGVKITDADGKELKAADIKDGSKLFVDVPAGAKPGNGSFSLKSTGEVDTGRLFVAENYAKHPAQSLIVADSEKTEVAAKAAASWSEAPAAPATTVPSTPGGAPSGGGELANTGVDAAVPFGIGGLLLGGGALMLLLNRRRSRA
ncbi:thioester domain-containing protein [Amycolatopsis sp. NPDC051716]|uniref:thioester domain-containing protein n=1 Tax=Amycolatopsis sp. NPDC051716 TaxID=3155804 RepID=UPI0034294E68